MEFPNKKYSVICADPPWSYRQKGAKGKKQGMQRSITTP